MSCNGSNIKLFYAWKKDQPTNKDESWYYDMYHKYYDKMVRRCREKRRKEKRE